MGEKNLSEQEWKKFAKGRDLKDAGLIKALLTLERAKAPNQTLAALDDLEKQSDTLRKSAKGDKELGKYLDDLDKAIKASEAETKKLAKEAAAKDQDGDDEEETPALLTSKMVPLIRQVGKGEEMQVLLANTGKEVAVLLSRRAVSPSKHKLLSDYLGAGTPKFFGGACVFEENAYTFVMKTQAAGLAKKLKAALLQQVGLRLKVRVRGEDPNDIDDDGEEAVGEQEGEGASASPRAAEQHPDRAGTPEQLHADPLEAQFQQRWAPLAKRILAALQDGAGDVPKIRAVADFVSGKARVAQFKAALQGADSLEKLLDALPIQQAADRNNSGLDKAAVFNARFAALLPQLKGALSSGTPAAQAAKVQAADAAALAKNSDFVRAQAALDDVENLLKSIDFQKRTSRDAALATWKQAQAGAAKQLEALQDGFRSLKHKNSARGVDIIQRVRDKIPEQLESLSNIQALRKYIESDVAVAQAELPNGFGVNVELRKPLLVALDKLERELQ